MTDRQRLLAAMRYERVDRAPCRDFGAWPETLARWKREGYDPDADLPFQTDRWDWQSGWFFPHPPFERRVVEENGETVLYVNHEGILMRRLCASLK